MINNTLNTVLFYNRYLRFYRKETQVKKKPKGLNIKSKINYILKARLKSTIIQYLRYSVEIAV